uniref:Uncharacterized protein n=1 Tax=viral metagenome TaxID=1070528 RepID=A0A6C0BD68_9ZZZZ
MSSDNSDNDDTYEYDSEEDSTYSDKKRPRKSLKVSLDVAVKTVEERALYSKLNKYFKNEKPSNIQKMVNIIIHENDISLRLLNWFAMKHSATIPSLQITNENKKVELFDIKISYRARLNAYSKKYFDPFRRGKRFDYEYEYEKKKTVETTLCQLNFFKWLFTYNLLEYVEKHYETLKHKMTIFNNTDKNKKKMKKDKLIQMVNKQKEKIVVNEMKLQKFNESNIGKVIITI